MVSSSQYLISVHIEIEAVFHTAIHGSQGEFFSGEYCAIAALLRLIAQMDLRGKMMARACPTEKLQEELVKRQTLQ